MKFVALLGAAFVLALCCDTTLAKCMEFFTGINRKGNKVEICHKLFKSCYNVEVQPVKSMRRLHEAIVYDGPNCSGNSRKLGILDGCRNDLSSCGWGGRVKSFKFD